MIVMKSYDCNKSYNCNEELQLQWNRCRLTALAALRESCNCFDWFFSLPWSFSSCSHRLRRRLISPSLSASCWIWITIFSLLSPALFKASSSLSKKFFRIHCHEISFKYPIISNAKYLLSNYLNILVDIYSHF